MKTFFIAVITLILGLVAGVLASRTDPTARLLDESVFAPGPALAASAISVGKDRFSAEQLSRIGMIGCYRDPLIDDVAAQADEAEDVQAAEPELDRYWRKTRLRDRAQTPQSSPRLSPPDISRLPGLIKLEIILSERGSERSHCGATRIAKNWFITAAHCVTYSQDVFDIIAMPPQVDSLMDGIAIQPVTHAVCHGASDYFVASGNLLGDDIALLYLENVDGFEDVEIAQVDLGRKPVLPEDVAKIWFAGWSQNSLVTERTADQGLILRDGSRFLQGGPLSVGVFGKQILRADPVNRLGPCQGDSGGPLYAEIDGKTELLAILSRITPPERQEIDDNGNPSDGCRPHKGAFFIRTSSYADWISRVRKTCLQDGRFLC